MLEADPWNFRNTFCRFLLGAAFVLTLIFLVAEIRMVRSPTQRDYGEGHLLWLTREILDTSQAYKPVDTMPYVVYPYTPLYMLAARLTGARSSSPRTPFLLRAASGAFACTLPLMMNGVAGWGSLMRVDMLALLLMYGGLAVYITLGQQQRWQYVAAILFVLALFTKQTMISAPLACLSTGLLVDWKKTVRLGMFAAALILAGAWFLNQFVYDGFLTNILGYNVNPFSWRTAILSTYGHVRQNWPWLAVSAAAVLGLGNLARIQRGGWKHFLQTRMAGPYRRAVLVAGLNSAFAFVSMAAVGKMGAYYNYFLAWDISACLLCGLFMYHIPAAWNWRGNAGRPATVACAILLLGLLLPSMTLVAGIRRSGVASAVPAETEIMKMIRQTSGPVFSENFSLLIQSGKPVEVEPATVRYLALSARWDEQPYLQLFADQYFDLLVANDIYSAERYSPAVTSAIERSYVLEKQIGGYSIHRPIQRLSPAR